MLLQQPTVFTEEIRFEMMKLKKFRKLKKNCPELHHQPGAGNVAGFLP